MPPYRRSPVLPRAVGISVPPGVQAPTSVGGVPDEITIRTLADDDAEGFRTCMDVAFHEETSDESLRRWLPLLPGGRTAMAFAGDRMVGTSAAFPQRMSVPGGELGCAGVTIVSVLPTHRRRGILTRMMARLFEQALEAGEPLAALLASEGGIYGRFGFGVAVQAAQIELDGGSPPPPRADGAPMTFELLPLEGAAPLLDPLWEAVRARRAGIAARTTAWWEGDILADHEDERAGGNGPKRLVVARDDSGAARGYAIYRAVEAEPKSALEVMELIAPDPETEAALWGYFVGVDLVGTVRAPGRPLDDPLRYRTAAYDQARVTRVEDGLWVRLLDLRAAIAGRSWSAPLDLVVDVADAHVPANAGRWRIEASAEGDGRCTATDRDADLVCDVSVLGALYLGGASAFQLADAGRIAQRRAGALDALDTALRTPRLPWAAEDF